MLIVGWKLRSLPEILSRQILNQLVDELVSKKECLEILGEISDSDPEVDQEFANKPVSLISLFEWISVWQEWSRRPGGANPKGRLPGFLHRDPRTVTCPRVLWPGDPCRRHEYLMGETHQQSRRDHHRQQTRPRLLNLKTQPRLLSLEIQAFLRILHPQPADQSECLVVKEGIPSQPRKEGQRKWALDGLLVRIETGGLMCQPRKQQKGGSPRRRRRRSQIGRPRPLHRRRKLRSQQRQLKRRGHLELVWCHRRGPQRHITRWRIRSDSRVGRRLLSLTIKPALREVTRVLRSQSVDISNLLQDVEMQEVASNTGRGVQWRWWKSVTIKSLQSLSSPPVRFAELFGRFVKILNQAWDGKQWLFTTYRWERSRRWSTCLNSPTLRQFMPSESLYFPKILFWSKDLPR